MFQVNKDVPLPKRSAEFPFRDMNLGDSFDIQLSDNPDLVESEVNKWRTKLSLAKKDYKAEIDPAFNIKSAYLKRERVLRVWKVEPKELSAERD